MTTIAASEVTTMAMVNKNEDKYKVVIDNGFVKEWVGIGWIEIRKATPGDFRKIPEVIRS
jgi:hypothetical protein